MAFGGLTTQPHALQWILLHHTHQASQIYKNVAVSIDRHGSIYSFYWGILYILRNIP
jgi:hypothetical protein